jgi:hypothetical protein
MFVMYSLAVYAMARRFMSARYAFIVALICTISSDALYLSDLLFAELPFALVTVTFVWSARIKRFGDWFPGILATAAFLLRSAGIALFGAWVGEALLKRQWKQAAIRGAIGIVPVIAWQMWISHVKSTEYPTPAYAYQRAAYQFYNVTYAENLRLIDPFRPERGTISRLGTIRRVVRNTLIMPASIGEAITMPRSFWKWAMRSTNQFLIEPPLIFFGSIALAGAVLLAWRGEWLVVLYLGASLVLICLTPWPKQMTRYFLPLAPFVALCAVQALAAMRESRFRRAGNMIFVTCISAILLIEAGASTTEWTYRFNRTGVTNGTIAPRLFYFDESWVSWKDSLDWLKLRAHPQDIVACSAPQLAHLETGLRCVFPPMESRPPIERQMLESARARFLILDSLPFLDIGSRYVEPMLKSPESCWHLVYNSPDHLSRIYERAEGKQKP